MLVSESLSFSYPGGGSGAVMRFPDINLPQGEVLLLQGASGSGKSTLLALCCALLSGATGRLLVANQDVLALKGSERDVWRGRSVGFLPQRLHLSESLSVRANLQLVFFAIGLPEDGAKINAVLQSLGVGDLSERRPSELSGGQAQRVALARAVLLSPKIILADEPTASLDDEAASQAITLLLQAAKGCGASLVVATHDARVKDALHAAGQATQHISLKNLSQIGLSPANHLRRVL
ncbi:ATP-binding cassette domain-containing protein [Variovorax sp. PCZ-1]|uniref:ABC transporter ATP-binding protein n=1 Tax=Variovorax sp. PCZ-1 TaxID=2835533 RepID=UPI001BCB82A9|nr:ATP-binding cassette domain-containing protein [Variovorax sp. PCZ-1]MBS7808343.1 ATP-binding cassette domain-containing protein [Variovorax sp. PCZ-1]